ncbi:MAG: hypothetical protein R3B90_09185 [Planctomycetaceae bacterium]
MSWSVASQLEARNRELLGAMSVLHYIHDARDGRHMAVTQGDRVVANLIVGQRDWGESQPEDVAAVVASVANTVFSAIPPQDSPTIIVLRSEHGPRCHTAGRETSTSFCSTRVIDCGHSCHISSHELGHVLCRAINEDAPQHWFEEAFCEAVSIWTLERMALEWKTDPPYSNWSSYAERLAEYAADVRSKVLRPSDFAAWYATHRRFLDDEPYDRDKNRVVASHIAAKANSDPDYLRAFLHLRSSPPDSNTIEALLQAWHSSCADDLKFVPRDVANLLGVPAPE